MTTINEVILGIIDDPKLERNVRDIDWTDMSFVISFDNEGELRGNFGYLYGEGVWYSTAFKPRPLMTTINAYEKALRPPSGEAMKSMLLQYNKLTGDFKTEFEYGVDQRWKVTPDNIDEAVEKLRPVWD